ncbi:hypothetical protein [Halorubrum sp. DM2]|uniref:hypothetical protein n=1 Tax=Halorubrum sp. DM2 TaxID=2527867 RepID=UPI0024B7790E|nr:hypothetical protein [Halorubrum sp. DM2]
MSRHRTHALRTRLLDIGNGVRGALRDLLSQEFSYSTGHVTAILNGCLFAPSLLGFWFVNGVLDFSTAIAIGAVATPAGLQVRLLAYLLVVPTFLLTRIAVHLIHPVHRKQVLSGSCPTTRLMSLDWFSVGILTTGLPLAIQNVGPWAGMNAVFLVGVFLVPRLLPTARRNHVKLLAFALGGTVFLYASYGGAVSWLPNPATVLGPVATATLDDDTARRLFRAVNSIAVGPLLVGLFGVAMNRILTRPELTEIPVVSRALPRRDPDLVVVTSAALGTAFYLLVVTAATGHLTVVP